MTSTSRMGKVFTWGVVALLLTALLLWGMAGNSFGLDLKLDGVFSGGILGTTNTKYDNAGDYHVGGGSYAAKDITAIDIDWIAGSVNIELYDGNQVQFSETSDKELPEAHRMRYLLTNGKLSLQYCESGPQLNVPSKTLTVRLPKSIALNTLDIESVSARVSVNASGMTIPALDIESVSGRVDISILRADSLALQSVSGSVYLTGAFRSIDLESVSGSAHLMLTETPERLRTESVSGNVEITVPEGSGFTAKLSSVSGSITCDFGERKSRKEIVVGDGHVRFDFDSVSGGVRIFQSAVITPTTPPKPAVEPSPTPGSNGSVPSSGRGF